MDIRAQLKQISGVIQERIAPTVKSCQLLYEETLKAHVRPDSIWLDVGCGHKLLQENRLEVEKELCKTCQAIIGLDPYWESLKTHRTIPWKVQGKASALPFQNHTFNLITANMAVEHFDADETERAFQEISRILKPGGLFIFHTPNVLGYDTMLARLIPEYWKKNMAKQLFGVDENDVFQTHYQANSASRIRALAQLAGLVVREINMVVTNAQLAIIPPLAFFEILWIRLLLTKPLKNFRHNILAILQKR